MDDQKEGILYALLASAVVACVVRWWSDPLRNIPTVGGPSIPILSYWGATNFLLNARAVLSTGYRQYYGAAFKVALFDQWLVVVSGPKMVDDLRKRPDDEASFTESVEEVLQTRFTWDRELVDDPYHLDVIKDQLVRTPAAALPDVFDELNSAIPQYIPAKDDEWTRVNIMQASQKIVARASNRVFVGLPLCHNDDYLELTIKFAIDIFKDVYVLGLAPGPLKFYVSRCFSAARRTIRQSMAHLQPLINERKAKMELYGDDYPGKPRDMLEGILEKAIPRRSPDYQITERLMSVNVAAIHTSSNGISHALLHLAATPEYMQPLRDEVEAAIATDGWTKAAMDKMWKIDSFLKESQRVNGVSLTAMTRKAMKDILLPDGTVVPKGTLITAASYPTHHDEGIYENALEFDPFRYARMRSADGEGMKHQYVHTSVENISFGHGKHACPGRFFASNELKAMLAYIIVNYDVKLPTNGPRPQNLYFANNVIPPPIADILFRRRPGHVG
ncbi:cytochrome P450 [Lentinus tigrinus ALCF2SS1-7]|uniref:Cytochrome P450 n=1 Tax=Lentinus tigrinus ALCF2SS1-6 TaxID=1328759 RepID=A0A5C2SHR8_9APHY|nr:cytochrome P450 [Lentinus tigrinus ALCF2SS1-6]RPD77580.1 cytochrome P450 [Lentinus tigrinus ALCF2SS1-7]